MVFVQEHLSCGAQFAHLLVAVRHRFVEEVATERSVVAMALEAAVLEFPQ